MGIAAADGPGKGNRIDAVKPIDRRSLEFVFVAIAVATLQGCGGREAPPAPPYEIKAMRVRNQAIQRENDELRMSNEKLKTRIETLQAFDAKTKSSPVSEEGSGSNGSASSPKRGTVITNSIGMEFAYIPAGEFLMGSPMSDEQTQDDETPQHRIRITKPLRVGVYEVTIGQFGAFVTATAYQTDAEGYGQGGWGLNEMGEIIGPSPRYSWRSAGFTHSDDHPVMNVSWNDAVKFCKWLSEKEAAIYRLPTEAEWEYACRAGSTTRYHFGDADAALRDFAWYHENVSEMRDERFVPKGGQKRANAWGLHDLHGNMSEWCSDWYAETYFGESPVADPQGPPKGEYRVKRGGGWYSMSRDCRSASRSWIEQANRSFNIGFRVVRTIAPSR